MTAYIIMDTETVPDLEAVERAEGDPDAYVQRLREERQREDVMIPWIYHRPIVLSGVYVHHNGDLRFVSYVEGRDDLVSKWWAIWQKEEPCVVTWNGRGFDLPVLEVAALQRGIDIGRWMSKPGSFKSWEDPRGRYSGIHWDLMDWATASGAAWRISQNAMASVLRIPGKLGDMDGSAVADLYAEGRIGEIEAYCACDILTLLCIFERACRTCGLIPTAAAVATGLSSIVYAAARVHDGEAVSLWERTRAELAVDSA